MVSEKYIHGSPILLVPLLTLLITVQLPVLSISCFFFKTLLQWSPWPHLWSQVQAPCWTPSRWGLRSQSTWKRVRALDDWGYQLPISQSSHQNCRISWVPFKHLHVFQIAVFSPWAFSQKQCQKINFYVFYSNRYVVWGPEEELRDACFFIDLVT